jgi:aspartate racemase
MSAIGIIGGMGPQASAQLLELLVRKAPDHMTIRDDSDFPEIVVVSVPVPNFVESKPNIQKAKQLVIERVGLLETAGCTVAGIACNTAHIFLPAVQRKATVPFLSMPKLVGKHIAGQGWRRVGLLATPNTLASKLYDHALPKGIVLTRPSVATAEVVERLIFRALAGKSSASDRKVLRQMVQDFRIQQRLDAVILGCTELPLIFGETKDASVIDTLAVLADGLLAHRQNARHDRPDST